LIPGFNALKKTANDAGALGSGISGSGPSVFALCKGKDIAEKATHAMAKALGEYAIEFDTYCSKINTQGIKILSEK